MEEIIPILREGLTRLGLPNAERAAEMLGIYARRLTEYNEKVNLTAITDPVEIATKHFLDCAACAPYIPQGSRCADVGTGAGFPGMVLAIVRPDLELVLFDSLQKRLNFLEELAQELGGAGALRAQPGGGCRAEPSLQRKIRYSAFQSGGADVGAGGADPAACENRRDAYRP